MKTTAKSKLTPAQRQVFGSKKQSMVNGFTIKYYLDSSAKIHFQVFRGMGKGVQLTSSENWNEILKFVHSDFEYKTIFSNEDGRKGGAYFFKGTTKMIFSNHPFIKNGYKF